MAVRFVALALSLASLVGMAGPAAAWSCSSRRGGCEAHCTPAHVARYHFGSWRRCTASCEPRWQQCLRTGIWVDLERQTTGGAELAGRY